MTNPKWPEPQTFDEAEERIDALVIDARLVEAQLGDRNRTDGTGARMDEAAYAEWRKRASMALVLKRAEVDFLKGWRRRRQKEFDRMVVGQNFRIDPSDPEALLLALYSVTHKLLVGQPLAPGDQRLVDLVADHVRDTAHTLALDPPR